jgi:hypothetical protein
MVSQARAQSPRRRVGPCGVSRGLRRESDAVDTNAATIRHQGLLRPGRSDCAGGTTSGTGAVEWDRRSRVAQLLAVSGDIPRRYPSVTHAAPGPGDLPRVRRWSRPPVRATSLTVSPLVRGAIAPMLIALAPLRAACARADTDERHEGWLPGAGLTDDPRADICREHIRMSE